MRARFHETAQRFLIAADSFLRSDPLSTNVVAVVASRIVAGVGLPVTTISGPPLRTVTGVC